MSYLNDWFSAVLRIPCLILHSVRYLYDDEVSDSMDFYVLCEAEEECKDPGKDHSERQEVAKVHAFGDDAAEIQIDLLKGRRKRLHLLAV